MPERALKALETIRQASETIDRLDPKLKAAQQELQDGILEAARAGVSVDLISRAASRSTARVYQILERARANGQLPAD